MANKENKSIIETLFHKFLKSSAKDDKDIEYCLLQSSVEPTIRFKFGSWLNKQYPERITLNLLEANRLDLVVGIDDHVYFIEFGHLLNLLQHGAKLNNQKVSSDENNLEFKVKKIISKIENIEDGAYKDYFQDKQKVFVLCSLFSDIKVFDNGERFETLINASQLNSGTLFKYGKLFSRKVTKEYFDNYGSFVKKEYMEKELKYPTGYTEVPIIPEKLSLHFKFDYPQLVL
jgi:hypothetical protein